MRTGEIRPGRTYVPKVDICETEDALFVWADLPGVDESSVDVRLDNQDLSIEARVALDEYEGLTPVYTEYQVGHFARRFRIGRAVDSERITAKSNAWSWPVHCSVTTTANSGRNIAVRCSA